MNDKITGWNFIEEQDTHTISKYFSTDYLQRVKGIPTMEKSVKSHLNQMIIFNLTTTTVIGTMMLHIENTTPM